MQHSNYMCDRVWKAFSFIHWLGLKYLGCQMASGTLFYIQLTLTLLDQEEWFQLPSKCVKSCLPPTELRFQIKASFWRGLKTTLCDRVDYCSNFSLVPYLEKKRSSSSLPIHTLCHVIPQCQEIEHAKYTALPATWSGDLLWPLECGWKRQCVSSQQFKRHRLSL